MQNFDFSTIIAFTVALVIFIKLHSVLGKRSDSGSNGKNSRSNYSSDDSLGKSSSWILEDKKKSRKNNDNIINLTSEEDKKSDSPVLSNEITLKSIGKITKPGTKLYEELLAVNKRSPDFIPEQFIKGARVAYEMIVIAFGKSDLESVKSFLSNEVFDNFSRAIMERSERNERVSYSLVGIEKSDILAASVTDEDEINIRIRFVSQMISATFNHNDDLIDGSLDQVVEVVDVWTFSRCVKSSDPNWKLIASESG